MSNIRDEKRASSEFAIVMLAFFCFLLHGHCCFVVFRCGITGSQLPEKCVQRAYTVGKLSLVGMRFLFICFSCRVIQNRMFGVIIWQYVIRTRFIFTYMAIIMAK